MTKKLCLLCLYIPGTIDHMTFIYVTHVQKDNICRFFVLFFQILIFRVNSGVKGQKMAQIDQKFCLSHSVSQEPYPCTVFWYTCVTWYLQQVFSFFQNADFWVFRGVKRQKMTHNYQFQSVTLYISRTVYHIIKMFGMQVWNNDIS